jgi:hypothetical protein
MVAVHSSGHTATLLATGQVLVAGGFGTQSQAEAELYDHATDRWTPVGAMAAGRFGHTATLLPEGMVLVTGGVNSERGGSYLATAELYDPSTHAWWPAATMSRARSGHTATLLADGQVLVAGGRDAGGPHASAERYDPAADRWNPAGALGTARWLQTAVRLPGGDVLIIGGRDSSQNTLTGAERYRPGPNDWASAP